uniref:adenylyltransferase/cytidyltransferase family protein n=1 Tax=Algoriphagus sp. TaxID=1872435 RepID=UPI0040484A51
MKSKIVIVSGYFNPIHKGHLEYFINAKSKGDLLFVIVNSDLQRALKGSKEFQKEDERLFLVQHIREVDQAFLSIDKDRSVCRTLEMIYSKFGSTYELAFANGGDQNNESIPEVSICQALGISLIDGLGEKIQSSSWLLSNNNSIN